MDKKSGIILGNERLHIELGNWTAGMSLQEQMKWEAANQLTTLNDKKNYKRLPREHPPWQTNYSCTARNVVRMYWLTNFLQRIFEQLLTTENSLADCCSEAYKFAFGAHHSYMIQAAAWAAMKAVGSREWLTTAIKCKDDAETRQTLSDLHKDMSRVASNLG